MKKIALLILVLGAVLMLPATALAAPANDNFADALAAEPLPFTDDVDLAGSTTEAGEPQICSFKAQSVWYVLRPTRTRVVRFDSSGSSSATSFNVFRSFAPGIGGLGFQTCGSGGGSAQLSLDAGATYYVQAGTFLTGSVQLRLAIEEIPPPPNDDFAAAAPVGSLPFASTVDTVAATNESLEPSPSCGFGMPTGSVWYAYTPSAAGSVSATTSGPFPTMVAAYVGSSLGSLQNLGCRAFGSLLTIRTEPGTTYYFQAGGLFGSRGQLRFALDVAPAPVAAFGHDPGDPTSLEPTQFFDASSDPGGLAVTGHAWDFGDGATSTEQHPLHFYAADGDYVVSLTVTTQDGRSASTSETVQVRTHDVAIVKLSTPQSASSGQTKSLSAAVANLRYADTVQVQLFKSVPGPAEFELVGTLVQHVPARGRNKPTPFDFSYTFTAGDASVGKVTFKAVATITTARDAVPGDNSAVGPPTRVSR
jgi:PKD repeat protein